MILTKRTIEVLRNFNSINANVLLKPGKVQSTISEAKNLYAEVELDVEFDREIGIYDLGEFLSVMNMVSDPNVSFEDDKVMVIRQDNRSFRYFLTPKNLLTCPPKPPVMPDPDGGFLLTQDVLSEIRKASSILSTGTVTFATNEDQTTRCTVSDPKNPTSNSFRIDIKEASDGVIKDGGLKFSVSNFKFLPGDYEVQFSNKLIAKFTLKGREESAIYYASAER